MIPVKLPKEVLSLFPTWEYRCHRCSTYVESNISFCPNCKMPFDEKKWRVPPRFFKSHEAMSDYAHKVLAPKLSPEQRKLLFKYFTEFFSDSFETEDDTFTIVWNGKAGTVSATVVADIRHHGSKSAKLYNADNTKNIWIKKNLPDQTTAFIRFYWRTDSLPASGLFKRLLFVRPTVDSGCIGTVTYWNDGGVYKWAIDSSEGASYTYTQTISVDEWYCVEAKFVFSTTVGELRLYINDDELITQTGLNTGSDGMEQFLLMNYPANDWLPNFHYDCVVVADTYIGPETTEQTYTKTWTTDALFKKLVIPKALSVDAAFQKQGIPKTFVIDADFLKRDILKSFAVDARFGALMTQTISRQIDVLLKKLDLTKNFGLDVYFGPVEAETYAKNFALDAIFAYKVRLPELWLDENGKIVLNISKPYTWVGS
jgi:hypothetical protein